MEKINVLAVDDQRVNLLVIMAALKLDDIELHTAASGEEALAKMDAVDFAVVLLDVQMPGMDGFDIAEQMRQNRRTKDTPIIFVTAVNKEEAHIFKGYETGAVDYLLKPIASDILQSKVRVFAQLYRQKIHLQKNIAALKRANRQLLQKQKEKIEEERLKVLFQLAGATAHELNQPLMALMGNIELMRSGAGDTVMPRGSRPCLDKIEASAKRIADIVKKIQTIQQDRVIRHDQTTSITDIHQPIDILYLEDDALIFDLVHAFGRLRNFQFERAATIKEGINKLHAASYQLIFIDYYLPDGTGLDFMAALKAAGLNIPVVVITGIDDETVVTNMIQEGACEYLPKSELTQERLADVCYKALERSALNRELEIVQQRLTQLTQA